jgi:hypothetical protein
VNRISPADRDRARQRVRVVTAAAAVGAAVLTIGGAAAAAGTFAGRTVGSPASPTGSATPTDPAATDPGTLQPPAQPPTAGGYAPRPVTSGGS